MSFTSRYVYGLKICICASAVLSGKAWHSIRSSSLLSFILHLKAWKDFCSWNNMLENYKKHWIKPRTLTKETQVYVILSACFSSRWVFILDVDDWGVSTLPNALFITFPLSSCSKKNDSWSFSSFYKWYFEFHSRCHSSWYKKPFRETKLNNMFYVTQSRAGACIAYASLLRWNIKLFEF